MQTLAIISLISALAILFKLQTKQVIEIGLDLIRNTRQAKLGKLEVQVDKTLEDISERIDRQSGWVQILLSQLTSDEVGILLAMSKTDKFPVKDDLKKKLRSLRNRGLIEHDEPKMRDSREVYLTKLGEEFVKILVEAKAG